MYYDATTKYKGDVDVEYYETLIDTIHTLVSIGKMEDAERLAKKLKYVTLGQ